MVEGKYIFPRVNNDNIDVYQCHPSKLPSALVDEDSEYAYFFTLRERKFEKGQRVNMTSSIHEVFDDINGSLLGRKNTVVYFEKATQKQKGLGIKTNWIMHEYVLDESLVPPKNDKGLILRLVVKVKHSNYEFIFRDVE
ncbi:NAC domain containing protein 74 [Forsythia ovata]|uniref:NAC domain containing protein 74 n=1 Tax=Forsythia ovata TaxID=205694 RepID=A0ABD1VG01_9LAMI